MMSTERLGRTTDRLKDSRRTMMETEEIGVSILQDLHGQRQSLLRAGDTVFAFAFALYNILLFYILHDWCSLILNSVT